MLRLDDEYFIEADKYGYTLKKSSMPEYDEKTLRLLESRGNKPSGEMVISVVGYYGILNDALDGYIETALRDSIQKEDLQIDDLIQRVRELKQAIRKVVE